MASSCARTKSPSPYRLCLRLLHWQHYFFGCGWLLANGQPGWVDEYSTPQMEHLTICEGILGLLPDNQYAQGNSKAFHLSYLSISESALVNVFGEAGRKEQV